MIDDIEIPDDATRPTAPKPDKLNAQQALPMRYLRAIHEHHRRNMRMMRTMLVGVRKGDTSASELHAHIKDNPMLENYRVFGTLCGQHCQLVNGHHSIEDAHMFPALEGHNSALDIVVKRLREEHEVVHALLVRLAEAAEVLIENPNDDQFNQTVRVHEALEKLLLSHFGYEEAEVGPALGVYNVSI
ncbi:hemerythrin domain-containing protein [Maritalea sp.]|uniref:hemerythrin domain-containing protein n=1 Tax=Maritalea sp. TaxID=2003361 RepID=UPI003EF915BA